MWGQYVITDRKTGERITVKNRITTEGKTAFLKMLLRDDATYVAAGGNFYIGLCDQVPALADTLADLSSEPSAAGGYARAAITRDSSGWPTLEAALEDMVLRSAVITFTASGADFDMPFSRLFMCDVASGTSGTLFSYSGALTTPITILDGESKDVQYELYL